MVALTSSGSFAYHTLQSIFSLPLLIALALLSRNPWDGMKDCDQIEVFASQLLPATASPFNRDNDAEALQPERRSWRYRRHCFAHHFDEIPISRCREWPIALGLEGSRRSESDERNFLSFPCRHSTFSSLKAQGLWPLGGVWQPFCLLSTSSPATCK